MGCTICDRTFASQRGLSQHLRRTHPDEYARVHLTGSDTTTRRRRWSDDERSALAILELEALNVGHSRVMDICRYMAGKHRGRSLDSIKAERRGGAYQDALQQQRLLQPAIVGGQQISAPASGEEGASADLIDEAGSSPAESGASVARNVSNVVMAMGEEIVDDAPVEVEYDTVEELRTAIQEGIELLEDKRKFLAAKLVQAAKDILENPGDMGKTMEWFTEVIGPKEPTRQSGLGRPRPKTVHPARSRREGISREYAKLQNLFRRNPKRAAKCILEGDKNVNDGPRVKKMFEFWEGVFGTEEESSDEDGGVDVVDVAPSNESTKVICGPIRLEELASSKPKRGTAPGPDGLTPTRWRVIPSEWKMLFYNIILYGQELPKELIEARTVFIPKRDDPRLPGDFRPISVTSVALRQFHTIMARRLQHAFAHDERQRAFQQRVDGSAENALLLNAILSDARVNRKELHLVSLDLSKAFDSVHHKSIISTLRGIGCPARLIGHLRRVYSGATTTLRYRGESLTTRVKRGVLQGDPMSPVLFNYIIDRALASLNSSLGYFLGDQRISAIAFADDIILVSGSKMGLQRNLDGMTTALRAHGLTLNVKKSFGISLVGVTLPSRVRAMVMSTEEPFTHGNLTIRQLGHTDEWSYLGTHFRGVHGCEVKSKTWGGDLERISRAKLKPQQKLFMLRHFVMPRQLHGLVLGKTSQGLLGAFDKDIRRYTRKWLHFPNDVPISYIHNAHRDGGLGVTSLSLAIPRMRLARIRRFAEGDSDLSRAFAGSGFAQRQTSVCKAVLEKVGVIDATKEKVTEYWRGQLKAKIDTAGLGLGDPVSHSWIRHPNRMTGAEFVRLNHLRAGCLPTAARLARGRDVGTQCRGGCNASETNYHVIQRCDRSKGSVRDRHNKVVRLVERSIATHFPVHAEPRFETTDGLKIPDLIAIKGNVAWVLDVQIVNDNSVATYHLEKRQKYQTCPGLNDQIRRRYNCAVVRHMPITMTYKGIIHCETASALRNHLNLGEGVLGKISLLALRGSYVCWINLRSQCPNGPRRIPHPVVPR